MIAHPGIVYLVGAGPGDPELITVRGLSLIRAADVVVHDRLIGEELLTEAKSTAELFDVGKPPDSGVDQQPGINQLLIDKAKAGKSVVRLKGGDPLVFGRGGEEMEACREAKVPYEVVPGVSSALAAPAAVGIPLTHRGVSRSFVVVTAKTADNSRIETRAEDGAAGPVDYKALSKIDTVVVLMGARRMAEFTHKLVAAGRDTSTPAAAVEWATTPRQRFVKTTLGSLAEIVDTQDMQPPVVAIIGATAGL